MSDHSVVILVGDHEKKNGNPDNLCSSMIDMMAHDSDVFEITSEATSKASGATKVLTEVSVMQRAPLVIRPLKATFD